MLGLPPDEFHLSNESDPLVASKPLTECEIQELLKRSDEFFEKFNAEWADRLRLRDRFAMAALTGIIVSRLYCRAEAPMRAYEIADAMLAARKQ